METKELAEQLRGAISGRVSACVDAASGDEALDHARAAEALAGALSAINEADFFERPAGQSEHDASVP